MTRHGEGTSPCTGTIATTPREEELGQELERCRKALAQQYELATLLAETSERGSLHYHARAASLQNTIAFRLGQALLKGFGSLRGLRALPGRLLALRKDTLALRQAPHGSAIEPAGKKELAPAIRVYESGGLEAVEAFIAQSGLSSANAGGIWVGLHHWLMPRDIMDAAQAARRARDEAPGPVMTRWLALRLFQCGALDEPVVLLEGLEGLVEYTLAELMRLEAARGQLRLLRNKPDLGLKGIIPHQADPASVLYVAASSLPFHQTGYTLRTHSIVRGLASLGRRVTVVTRPGYPWDRSDITVAPGGKFSRVDGIEYRHCRVPASSMPLDVYAQLGANVICREAGAVDAGVIHAASNHVNALPALIAARRLGIPFHYEMRGIWELSRASKTPGFDRSEAFATALDAEGFIAAQADRLFVISGQLGEYAVANWNVDPARISIMPNGADGALLEAESASAPDSFTIGYAGALVPYEGLDILIEALAILARRDCFVKLVIIGDGEMRRALENQVSAAGLGHQVQFLGRIPQVEAQERLRNVSLVCVPRRPDRVCEIIPPLKLQEAMALGLPVLVPDLPVFLSEVEAGQTGLFFNAGDAQALADSIATCVGRAGDLASIGQRAREHVRTNRNWATILECADI